MTVDEFVKRRVLPEHQGIVKFIRQVMSEMAPEAKEGISYGIPAWKGKRMIAVISPTKKDITFAFSRGAELKDKYKLLRGVGKVSKHLKFKTEEDVKKTVLGYYIKQALDLDAR